jgi:hypothetical protein
LPCRLSSPDGQEPLKISEKKKARHGSTELCSKQFFCADENENNITAQ